MAKIEKNANMSHKREDSASRLKNVMANSLSAKKPERHKG